MELKKHWNGNENKDIITAKNSTLKMMEITVVSLKAGESVCFSDKDKEYGIVILGGTCTVAGEGFNFEKIGKRKNVFDGTAASAYVPRNRKFAITGVTDVKAVVCKCPAEKDFEPVYLPPEGVIVKNLGKEGWKRQAHFVVDERIQANLVYIGEAFVEGGMWASYPPHKHDEDNMPKEGILEEIYYYEFDRPTGMGVQMVYSKNGEPNETYTVRNGDFVEIPKGYHPFCCAPGYKNYYLWLMAGKNRGFFMTTDEDHVWLNK